MDRAVLFDLDGTLLDPNGSIRATLHAVLVQAGHEPIPPQEVLIGMPLRHILATRTGDAAAVEAMVQGFRDHFLAETWRQVVAYPGVMDVVDAVREAGARTAVVTTKGQEEAEALLERLGHRGRFDAIVGDDDLRPVKPDPAPVLHACGLLGVAPAQAVMVGDTLYDMASGKAAGTSTLGVGWGHGQVDGAVEDAAALRCALMAWLGSAGAGR